MKYFIIAGEASGDLHASNLVKELRKKDDQAIIQGFGGELMHSQGVVILKDIEELSFMGFWEVAKNLKTITKNIKFCIHAIEEFNPDMVIFVDYPGFNLRIAQKIKHLKLIKYFYISPTVWAWKKSRVNIIKDFIDKLFVILPFEKKFYADEGIDVEFLGHPLLDAIQKNNETSKEPFLLSNKLSEKPILALLPGSRLQELNKILPEMLKGIQEFNEYQVIIAGAPGLKPEDYDNLIVNKEINVLFNQTQRILQFADLAIVTSGTATLEAALMGTPQVVCYKTSKLSYFIARLLVNVKYISLVNLIMEEEVVKELIQKECSALNIKNELRKLSTDEKYQTNLKKKYQDLESHLGGKGASARIASYMISNVNR